MLRQLFYLMILTSLISLSACHIPAINNGFGPNQAQKQCITQCTQELHFCQKICFKNCSNCCANSQLKAKEFLRRYQKQAKVEGQIAFSSLQSFDDPLKCSKNSCDCQADYLLCKQNCLDKIQKRLKIYKFC